jgi:hypothetical protein
MDLPGSDGGQAVSLNRSMPVQMDVEHSLAAEPIAHSRPLHHSAAAAYAQRPDVAWHGERGAWTGDWRGQPVIWRLAGSRELPGGRTGSAGRGAGGGAA